MHGLAKESMHKYIYLLFLFKACPCKGLKKDSAFFIFLF